MSKRKFQNLGTYFNLGFEGFNGLIIFDKFLKLIVNFNFYKKFVKFEMKSRRVYIEC